MGHQLATYINFQGRAREALELYRDVLGGDLKVYAEDAGRIQHAVLTVGEATIIGTDGHPQYPAAAGENFALALTSDRESAHAAFDRLAEGGQVKGPISKQAWGETGWLTDRFGINWMISVAWGAG